MIRGTRLVLRPMQDQDWSFFEEWGRSREALWGPYQRFQLDHLPALRQAYQQSGLLSRHSGFLIIETTPNQQVIGFVRYSLISYPDADHPVPEIGFGIPELSAQRKGYAKEALNLLVNYLFNGYAVERIMAFTEIENLPAQHVMETCGFQREGVLRRSIFRDGGWRDIAIYALLRDGWTPSS